MLKKINFPIQILSIKQSVKLLKHLLKKVFGKLEHKLT